MISLPIDKPNFKPHIIKPFLNPFDKCDQLRHKYNECMQKNSNKKGSCPDISKIIQEFMENECGK